MKKGDIVEVRECEHRETCRLYGRPDNLGKMIGSHLVVTQVLDLGWDFGEKIVAGGVSWHESSLEVVSDDGSDLDETVEITPVRG
jgi:hypothetical protein